MAVFTLDNGRTRTVHFGSAGASDYTQHRDPVAGNSDVGMTKRLFRQFGSIRQRPNWSGPFWDIGLIASDLLFIGVGAVLLTKQV